MEEVLQDLNEQKRKLASFKKMAEDLRTQRIVNETNLQNLVRSQEEIIQKCQALGYDPNRLKETLLEKTNELKQLTAKLDQIMPLQDGTFPDNVNQIIASIGASAPVEEDYSTEGTEQDESVSLQPVPQTVPQTEPTAALEHMDFGGLATSDFDFGDMMI